MGLKAYILSLYQPNPNPNPNPDWLHEASRNGHTECVALLLESQAHPDVQDKDRRTPLHLATTSPPAVALGLVAVGADHGIKDKFNRTPLMCFCEARPTLPLFTLTRSR